MKIDAKKQIVADLHERFKASKAIIVTDYKGLDVGTMGLLRKQLREAGVEYQVVKNSLLVRAVEGTDAAVIRDAFRGPSAVAISSEDPVAPAKVLTAFAKDNDKLELKIGVLDGKLLELSDIKALAELPSREVLLAQLLGGLNNIPTSLVRTLNAIPTQLLNVLVAIKDQKEQEAA